MSDNAEIDELRRRLAAVEGRTPEAVSRRRLLRSLATAAAVGVVGVAAADPAAAEAGDPVILGQVNSSLTTTTLTHPPSPAPRPRSVVTAIQTGYVDPALESQPATAVYGAGLHGVHGRGAFAGVVGQVVQPEGGYGVIAWAEGPMATGLRASAVGGPGLVSSSVSGAVLELMPSARTGPPTSGTFNAGSMSMDQDLQLWVCTVAGTPGTWTLLVRDDTASGRTVTILPLRAIDTRSAGGKPTGSPTVPGQVGGVRSGGTSVTLDLAGVLPIPDGASGVVGNLTVASPTYSGFLTAQPAGGSAITSSLNFPKSVAAVANAFTSGLGPTGLKITFSGTATDKVHLIVDITAYLT